MAGQLDLNGPWSFDKGQLRDKDGNALASFPIHPGGLGGPLLAEAKLMLQKAGIETARPAPGATRQGWLTYREVPMVLVVEAKDRTALSDALGVLLHEGGCDRYLLVAKKDWCVL